MRPSTLLFLDAASFAMSSLSLLLVRASFNKSRTKPDTSISTDVKAGLAYIWSHPLLRTLTIVAAITNFFLVNANAQIVLLAKSSLRATPSEVGWLFSAGSAGVIVFSLLAGRLRRRFAVGQVALAAIFDIGLCIAILSVVPSIWLALPLWAGFQGSISLWSINASTVRQTVCPEEMLGRVITFSSVLSWSIEPPAAMVGGYAVGWLGGVNTLFAVSGLGIIVVAAVFARSLLGQVPTDSVGMRSGE